MYNLDPKHRSCRHTITFTFWSFLALHLSFSGLELHEWHSFIPLMSRFFSNQNSPLNASQMEKSNRHIWLIPSPLLSLFSCSFWLHSLLFSFSFFDFDPMLSNTPLHLLPLISAPANKKAINSLWFCQSVFVPLPSFFSSSSSYGFGRSFRGNTFFWLLFIVRSSLGGWESDTHRLNITALFNTARSYVAGWQP